MTVLLNSNPYFETDTAVSTGFDVDINGWNGVNGTAVRSTAQFRLGAASAFVTPSGSGVVARVEGGTANQLPAVPGQSFTASAWVRPTNSTKPAAVQITWRDSSGAFLSSSVATATATPLAWQFLTVTANAPAGAAFAAPAAGIGSTPTTADTAYVDDIKLSTLPQWIATGGTVSRSTAQAHEGSASMLFTPDGVTATVEARSENATGVVPGATYRVSAWVRCAVSRSVSANIVWRDSLGTFLSSAGAASYSVAANTWSYIEVVGVAPASAGQGQVSISMGSTPATSNTLHIDEAKLEKLGVDIVSTYNNSYHSPGFDLSVSGLTGYSSLSVERVSANGTFSNVPVRGADDVAVAGTLFGDSDYEAPINDPTYYRVTAKATLWSDTFERTVANGFGLAPFGALWNILSGTAADFSVSGGTGVIALPTASSEHAIQPDGLASSDFDITLQITPSQIAAGGAIVAAVAVRYPGGDNQYQFEVQFSTVGGMDLVIRKVVAGAATTLASTTSVTSYNAGTPRFIRIYKSTSDLRMKGWLGSEPPTWNISAVDATYTASGTIGLRAARAAANTNTNPTVAFDSFTVTRPDGGTIVTTVATSTTQTITTTDAGVAWLKSVGVPTLSRRVNIVDWDDVSRPGRILGEYEVLGRRNKVVITDVLGGREGSFTIATFPSGTGWWSDSFWADVQTLIAEGGTLFLQTAGKSLTGEPDMYLAVKDVGRKRIGVVGGELVHLHTIEYVEVDRPESDGVLLSLRTWQDVINQNATWSEVATNYSTWLDVLQRSI